MEEQTRYRWPLSKTATAEVTITGSSVNTKHLEMLRRYLELAKDALQEPEVEADVVRRYQAGEKASVIQTVHGLSPGSLYRILHKHKVELRRGKASDGESDGVG